MVNFDIDQQEIVHIRTVSLSVPLSETNILEIGCGSGRLTNQLAPLAGSIMAIEPDEDQVRVNIETNTHDHVTYRAADATSLPFADDIFDLVVFSLSLCCIEPESQMRTAVLEAVRVLRSGGHLINLMPSTVRNFDAGWMWYYLDPNHQAQVFDMSVAAARMALKQVCFNDGLIKFVEERTVQTRWSYDTIDEMKDKWQSRYQDYVDQQNISDPDHRTRFERHLQQFLDQMPMTFDMFEEMQVLQK